MKPSDAFFDGTRYAVFGARAQGRAHGPVLLAALRKAGKQVIVVGPATAAMRGVEAAATLRDTNPVDGAVLLPPSPWNASAVAATQDAVRQCQEAGLDRIWIYTAGDPSEAVEIARQAGLDPCAGRCPCLHIVGGGFPHGTHRTLLRLLGQL